MTPSEHARALLSAAWTALAPRPAPRQVRKLVVIGYGAIGDTIFFLPVLDALRRAHPEARLVWVSNPAPVGSELIPATGLADDVWLWEAQGDDPAGRAALNARLAAADFDLAVLSLGAPAHDFLRALAGIPVVAGHRRRGLGAKRFVAVGEYARLALVNRPAEAPGGEHALARNLRLLAALGLDAPADARPRLPVPPEAREKAEALLAGLPAPLWVLHLGPANNQYGKMWAPERFAELSKRLAPSWGAPVLVGSAEEAESERRFLAAGGGGARSLVGKTRLLETFAVLARAALLVSNDTGVAKAAAALGVPTATLWGPSDPAEFRSPWDPERHLDVRTGIACSPCTRMGMPFRPLNYLNCGHRDCLNKLEAASVASALLGRWPALPKS